MVLEHSENSLACCHVLDDGKPILFVTHEHDGDWQFLCGGLNHMSADQARVVCAQCMMERHPEVEMLCSLEPGTSAERSSTADRDWRVKTIPEYDD